ncbi:PRC-barrel domain-containing protein [Pedobacter sp. GR22-6]|uniref:PRC-barrel domain-containing protein n=1 Tax=Pedobacter sp. GR22-6 TaxID=3127957 RepID=UPI00307EF003
MKTYENNRTTYLEELSGSDFEIADHQPDIIGWEIVDNLGNEIGEVEDLIFDSNARKVRYIVASLDLDEEIEAPDAIDDRLVLIPIGIVELDEDDDEVIIPEVSAAFLYSLPLYTSGKIISPAEELAVRYAFLGASSLPDADAVVYEEHPEGFYTHGHFDDARFNRRITGSGGESN